MQETRKPLNYVYTSTMSESPFPTPQWGWGRVLICQKRDRKSVQSGHSGENGRSSRKVMHIQGFLGPESVGSDRQDACSLMQKREGRKEV